MRNAPLGMALLGAAIVFSGLACSGSASVPLTHCTPGASVACAGPGACAGYQVCNANGTGLGTCMCGDAGAPASASSSGGSASSGGAATGGSSSGLADKGTASGVSLGSINDAADELLPDGAPSSTGESGAVCSAASCSQGCCDAVGVCQTNETDTACGNAGAACTDCTTSAEVCSAGACVAVSSSSASGGSGSSGSGGGCVVSSCKACTLGTVTCSSTGHCECCLSSLCTPD